GLVRVDQALALTGRFDGRRATFDAAQRDPGPLRQALDRLHKAQMVDLLHEVDDVAALTTAVAEIHVAGLRDGERRRLLIVERAQALEVAAAGRLERDLLGRDVDDRRTLAHQRDVLVANPPTTGHAANPTVTYDCGWPAVLSRLAGGRSAGRCFARARRCELPARA